MATTNTINNIDTVKEIKLTKEGYDRIKAELDERINVRRPEILARIQEARAQGDLSENAEYSQAREDQSFNEGAIAELEAKLKLAVIIKEKPSSDKVSLGSTVVLEDIELKLIYGFKVVGTEEADAFNGFLSNDCPVGNAIIGHKAGDTVMVDTLAGNIEYRIISLG